ncbi:MAG: Sulfite exporter TauE/SafE [Lentisphaerae bacterium ADurb.BinA184]|nr:MAG: Sulfite exporter TauE/SafE [Lentisphaerae bacterium ADurb.BinA184]
MDYFLFINIPGGGRLSVLLLFALGAIVGLLGSFFGVGGGWIVTPVLSILGLPITHAVGTGFGYMLGMSGLAAFKHRKYGHTETGLAVVIGLTTMAGIELGKRLMLVLDASAIAEPVVGALYVVLLLGLGVFLVRDGVRAARGLAVPGKSPAAPPYLRQFRSRPQVFLPQSGFYVSFWPVAGLGVGIGFLSGLMGVGGGFVLMPIMVYLMGMPTVVAVGTSLLCVLLASPFGMISYAMHGRVLFPAVAVMVAGAFIGVPLGAHASRVIRGRWLRLLYGVMIIAGGLSVLLHLLDRPLPGIGLESASRMLIVGGAAGVAGLILLMALFARGREA